MADASELRDATSRQPPATAAGSACGTLRDSRVARLFTAILDDFGPHALVRVDLQQQRSAAGGRR